MKKNTLLIFCLLIFVSSEAQVPPSKVIRPVNVLAGGSVTIFDQSNYRGQSKTFSEGSYALTDFNDKAVSVKMPTGFVALLYTDADNGGGYGISVDLMEDCPDLSVYNLNNKVSYITVFKTPNSSGFVWVRNKMSNGQFVSGHWERPRANGQSSNTNIAAVSPPLPGHNNNATAKTVLSVNGSQTTITSLGTQSFEDALSWNHATNDQDGIIGNDYRGVEELGTACFERASNNRAIPDNINFWYLQQQKNDHRTSKFYKRTLCGTLVEHHQSNISGTFEDYDVNMDIRPNLAYQYLLTDAHPREYTSIMSAEWHGSLHDEGQENCDDPKSKEEFTYLEAEVATEHWPQGNHTWGLSFLDMALSQQTQHSICVYGPWIYDKGHCCHPEIHPAEEVWWRRTDLRDTTVYHCNVICDASKRFWWRHQMDDGTKLKPWAEPPVKGLFAIAFEVSLGRPEIAITPITKKFEVKNESNYPALYAYNVIEYPGADQVYNLIYQNKTLVSFIPHNDAFKVSFEKVGFDAATNSVKGFLVIETSVGVTKQIAISVNNTINNLFPNVIKVPPNSDPSQVPEIFESLFFEKVEGKYLFTVIETDVTKPMTSIH